MDITGKIVYVGPIKSTTRADGRGELSWREFVVEYEGGQYPKRILFEAPADERVMALEVGQMVGVRYDCTVRKYTDRNGRERLINHFSLWRGDSGLHPVGFGPGAAPAPEKKGDPALAMFD